MYCNICASDDEFINFLNKFIIDNDLSVYDPINEKWLKNIDNKVNAKSSFIYNIAIDKVEDELKNPVNFDRFLSVHKYCEADLKVFCGVISCENKNTNTKKIFLKLKRNAEKNFEKGMKWLDEQFNAKPNKILSSYFWSINLDKNKKYFSSDNAVNQIIPSK